MIDIYVNYINAHIKYNVCIVNMSDKSDNIQFDLNDMDGVIKLIAKTLILIDQDTPVTRPLPRVTVKN